MRNEYAVLFLRNILTSNSLHKGIRTMTGYRNSSSEGNHISKKNVEFPFESVGYTKRSQRIHFYWNQLITTERNFPIESFLFLGTINSKS